MILKKKEPISRSVTVLYQSRKLQWLFFFVGQPRREKASVCFSVWKRCLNCQMLPYLTASSAVDGQGQSCVRWANDVLLELPVFPQHAHGKPVDGTAGLLWWDSPGEKTEGPEGISWAETGRVVRSKWRLLAWLPRHPHYDTGALPALHSSKTMVCQVFRPLRLYCLLILFH